MSFVEFFMGSLITGVLLMFCMPIFYNSERPVLTLVISFIVVELMAVCIYWVVVLVVDHGGALW